MSADATKGDPDEEEQSRAQKITYSMLKIVGLFIDSLLSGGSVRIKSRGDIRRKLISSMDEATFCCVAGMTASLASAPATPICRLCALNRTAKPTATTTSEQTFHQRQHPTRGDLCRMEHQREGPRSSTCAPKLNAIHDLVGPNDRLVRVKPFPETSTETANNRWVSRNALPIEELTSDDNPDGGVVLADSGE